MHSHLGSALPCDAYVAAMANDALTARLRDRQARKQAAKEAEVRAQVHVHSLRTWSHRHPQYYPRLHPFRRPARELISRRTLKTQTQEHLNCGRVAGRRMAG